MDRVEGSSHSLYGAAPEKGGVPSARARSVKAGRLKLPEAVSLDDAIAAILTDCLRHFALNAAALQESGEPETLHQLRVALRRLRAFFGLLKGLISCPDATRIATRAKEIANAVGPSRDWDVFCENLEGEPRELLQDEPSFYALIDAAELRRIEAQRAARTALTAAATQEFETDLRDFIARRPWREGAEVSCEPGSARDFAAKALHRLRRRALKRCEGLEDASPEQRHKARIAIKKARYAAEIFESLFGARKSRVYLRGLAKIQDELGLANDRVTAARLLAAIIAADPAMEQTPAVSFVQIWRERAAQETALWAKDCARRLRRFTPFWT